MEKMEPIFDLHKRTLRFATQIVKYVRTFPRDVAGFEIGSQLIRAGTSPGANYEEADACSGTKEFIYKIRTCLKESQETRYWLTLSKSAFGESELNTWLLNEVDELIRIFNSMIAKTIKRRKSQDQSSNKSQA
jgi:four helix bundle protein